MAAIFYPLLVLVEFWLFFRLWKLRRKSEKRNVGVLILQVVLFSLMYDGLVLSLGRLIGEGILLAQLNVGRYLFYAIFSPLLMVTGMEFAARADVRWAQMRVFRLIIWIAVISLIGFGTVLQWQFRESLMADSSMGILRYVHETGFLPFAPLLTTLVLMILGMLIWRHIKWPWVFLGALVMFIASAVPLGLVGPVVNSGAQVLLLGALVATERRLLTPDYSLSASELDSRISQVMAGRSNKK
ncbi:MAG: hypothetical protein Fur0022_37670 [Anaerolineales bacterium]